MPNATCARFEPAIAAMLDGTLDAASSAGLVDHLMHCASCNEVAAAMSMARDELKAVPEPDPQKRQPTSSARYGWWPPRSGLAWGVPLALVATLFLVIGYLLAPNSSVPAVHVAPDPSRAEKAAGSPAMIDPFASRSTPDEPRAAGNGHLSINCRPYCERLVLDGVNLGPSPVVKHRVQPGKHEVVGYKGKRSKRVTVVVKAERSRSVVLDMGDVVNPLAEETGRVSIACSPACERVLVDGRNIGASPIPGYRLPAGPHDFVFVRGKERKQRRVVVQAGKIFRINVLMSQEDMEW